MLFITIIVSLFVIVVSVFLVMMHLGFRAPRQREVSDPGAIDIAFSEESIPAASGKKLFAWLLPAVGTKAGSDEIIIIIHGWGGNSEYMLPVASPFHHSGINVLLVDSRNHGNSDSDSFSSLPRFSEDMDSAIDWLKTSRPG